MEEDERERKSSQNFLSSQKENPHCPQIAFVWTELDQNPILVTIHVLRGHFKYKKLYFCYWTLAVCKIVCTQILYPLYVFFSFKLRSGVGVRWEGKSLAMLFSHWFPSPAIAQWVTHARQFFPGAMENETVGWEGVIKLDWLFKITEK